MNFRQNTKLDVWHRMPPTKFLLGRQRVDELVEKAVFGWPTNSFSHCKDSDEIAVLADAYAQRLARDQFGSILMFLFIGLVTALVQVLLEWWLLSPSYRIAFSWWQKDLL